MSEQVVIYRVTCSVNGKNYVGQAREDRLKRRWIEHRSYARQGHKKPLYHAMRAHGVDTFAFEILESCASRDDANNAEQFWIDWYDSRAPNGYNLTAGGDGCYKPSDETLRRMSAASSGRRWSTEARQRLSDTRKGRAFSDAHKAAISAAKKGVSARPPTDEARANHRAAMKAWWANRKAAS